MEMFVAAVVHTFISSSPLEYAAPQKCKSASARLESNAQR
jgi:hypothetical protein